MVLYVGIAKVNDNAHWVFIVDELLYKVTESIAQEALTNVWFLLVAK